jgi:hypothetical protein
LERGASSPVGYLTSRTKPKVVKRYAKKRNAKLVYKNNKAKVRKIQDEKKDQPNRPTIKQKKK